MSRRRSPRPATQALRAARARFAPKTGLAAVQSGWAEMVGPQLAAVASPVSERDGEVTVECDDSVWLQELDLMQSQLLQRLEEHLGEAAPRALRFRLKDSRP